MGSSSTGWAVADGRVTADAAGGDVVGVVGEHVLDDAAVAVDAVVLQDVGVLGADADRLVEVLEGEALGVPEAVLRLGPVLGEEVVRRVAVVARGVGVVGGLGPAVVV